MVAGATLQQTDNVPTWDAFLLNSGDMTAATDALSMEQPSANAGTYAPEKSNIFNAIQTAGNALPQNSGHHNSTTGTGDATKEREEKQRQESARRVARVMASSTLHESLQRVNEEIHDLEYGLEQINEKIEKRQEKIEEINEEINESVEKEVEQAEAAFDENAKPEEIEASTKAFFAATDETEAQLDAQFEEKKALKEDLEKKEETKEALEQKQTEKEKIEEKIEQGQTQEKTVTAKTNTAPPTASAEDGKGITTDVSSKQSFAVAANAPAPEIKIGEVAPAHQVAANNANYNLHTLG